MAPDNLFSLPSPGSGRGKNIHAGHRQRMKKKLLEHGGDALADHELLELLLFYTRPQVDVNPLAHELVNRFGSLKQVLDAEPEELTQIAGITDNTAALFRVCYEIMLRYQRSSTEIGTILSHTEEAADAIRPYFLGAKEELVYLLCLDSKCKLLSCDWISQGSADAVLLNQRKIVQRAISRRASQVYLAHCHVTGLAWPSREDIWATNQLAQALGMLHITLVDHLIFCDGDYVSMVQSELMDPGSY